MIFVRSRRSALRLLLTGAAAAATSALSACVIGPSQATPVPQPPVSTPLGTPAATTGAAGTAAPVGTGTPPARTALRLSTTGSPADLLALRTLIDSFNQKNPDLAVAFEPVGSSYTETTRTALAAGTGADVVAVNGQSLGPWLRQTVLADIDAALSDAKADRLGLFVGLTDVFSYQGGTYGLPYGFTPWLLYVNKGLFGKASQPLPDPTWTWERFTAAAKALTNTDGSQVGFAPGTGLLDWASWVGAAGGALFNSTIDPSTCRLDSPAAAMGVQTYADLWLKRQGATDPTKDAASDPATRFASGLTAMAAGPTDWIPAFQAQSGLSWDVSFLPAGPGGHATPLTVTGLAVAKSSGKVPAAARLLAFLCATTDSQIAIGKAGTIVPAYRQAAFSPDYLKSRPDINQKVFVQALDFGLGPFRSPSWPDVVNLLDPGMQPVWKGEASAADTLKTLTPQGNAILQQGRATPTPATAPAGTPTPG